MKKHSGRLVSGYRTSGVVGSQWLGLGWWAVAALLPLALHESLVFEAPRILGVLAIAGGLVGLLLSLGRGFDSPREPLI